MKNYIFALLSLLLSVNVYAANEVLELNKNNCDRISQHGIYEIEAIARTYRVSMATVKFIDAGWGASQYGGEQCSLIFDTPKGPKKCYVFVILTSDKGKTLFGVSVVRREDNAVCF